MTGIERYMAPRSLNEAVQAMAHGGATVFCGGTDLTVQTRSGQRHYGDTLINVRHIDGLAGVHTQDGAIRIGSLTTVTELMNDPSIRQWVPLLVEAGDRFASDQIRNAASVGGNLCNASPAGDLIIPLLVLDAVVELACWNGGDVQTRRVPLDGFFVAPGKTVKRDEELLTAVEFDRPADGFVARFRKSGPRPALEISSVSVGVGGVLENGRFENARMALGAAAPTPLRARHAEAALSNRPLDAQAIQAAVEGALEDASPIDDVRASAWYRRHLIRIFTEEVLNDVLENTH